MTSNNFSGIPLTSVATCVGNSSLLCDNLVVQACVGSNSITCACVNSPIPCATTAYSLCSNNPLAYKPFAIAAGCNAPLLCNNNVSTGSNTIVDDAMQICSTSQPYVINFVYIVMFFIFVIILVVITTRIFVYRSKPTTTV